MPDKTIEAQIADIHADLTSLETEFCGLVSRVLMEGSGPVVTKLEALFEAHRPNAAAADLPDRDRPASPA